MPKSNPAGSDRARNPLPPVGSIFSFRTARFSEFAPLMTSRFGAVKILGANSSYIVIGVLDGIWGKWPSLDDACKCSVLRQYRFAYTGALAVFGVNTEWWSVTELDEATLLGVVSPSSEEAQLATNIFRRAPGSRFGLLASADSAAEGEWRWAHDREALVAEQEQVQAKQAATRAAQEERHRTRLKKLTWRQLLEETPFERWSTSPPFPAEEFTRAARSNIHAACSKLMALGTKPRKADVRAVLRECVLWFNDADDLAGGVIETEEREDICAALEEMAYLARHPALMSEIDNWRNW